MFPSVADDWAIVSQVEIRAIYPLGIKWDGERRAGAARNQKRGEGRGCGTIGEAGPFHWQKPGIGGRLPT
jgi:hypothetical protein